MRFFSLGESTSGPFDENSYEKVLFVITYIYELSAKFSVIGLFFSTDTSLV